MKLVPCIYACMCVWLLKCLTFSYFQVVHIYWKVFWQLFTWPVTNIRHCCLSWCLWIRSSQYNSRRKSNEMPRCINILFHIYMNLSVFRATHCTILSHVVYNITIQNCIFLLQHAKPEAASAVLGCCWWAVCHSKQVELHINMK